MSTMLARKVAQITSNKTTCPFCQARKVPSVTQMTQMKASTSTTDAIPVSSVAGVLLRLPNTLLKETHERHYRPMNITIASKIKALRKEKGYTLDELAELADSSKSYIWELENKNPPRPSAEKLAKIAKALGVTMDYFINDEITEEDATDQMFYRKYRQMDPEVKKKIRKMIDLWDEE